MSKLKQVHPLLNPPFWVPKNMTEYLFCNDNGHLEASEEAVKALSADFQQVLTGVYESMQAKFEATMNVILQENDLENVDFPLIAPKL